MRTEAGWSVFGKYREIFVDRHLLMSLKRKVFNQCVFFNNGMWMSNMYSHKSISKTNLKDANKP